MSAKLDLIRSRVSLTFTRLENLLTTLQQAWPGCAAYFTPAALDVPNYQGPRQHQKLMPDPLPSLLAYSELPCSLSKYQDVDGTSLSNYAFAPISGGLTSQALVSA